MSLLTAFEMLAALTYPFLAFQNEVGELIANFKGEKLQKAQAEKKIDLDVFVIFGLGKRALENLREQFAKADGIRPAGGAQIDARKKRGTDALTNDIKKILAGSLHELGAQENVVVDVVHSDGQGSHGNGELIAL